MTLAVLGVTMVSPRSTATSAIRPSTAAAMSQPHGPGPSTPPARRMARMRTATNRANATIPDDSTAAPERGLASNSAVMGGLLLGPASGGARPPLYRNDITLISRVKAPRQQGVIPG